MHWGSKFQKALAITGTFSAKHSIRNKRLLGLILFLQWPKCEDTEDKPYLLVPTVASYSNESVSFKWAWPILRPSPLRRLSFLSGRKEASKKFSFERKISFK